MSDGEWLMRIEGALSAHFNQDDGPSRPGIAWSVGLLHNGKTYKAVVTAFMTDDATAETRADMEYQGKVVMQYLNDKIQAGWHPDNPMEHAIDIGNPIIGRRASDRAS